MIECGTILLEIFTKFGFSLHEFLSLGHVLNGNFHPLLLQLLQRLRCHQQLRSWSWWRFGKAPSPAQSGAQSECESGTDRSLRSLRARRCGKNVHRERRSRRSRLVRPWAMPRCDSHWKIWALRWLETSKGYQQTICVCVQVFLLSLSSKCKILALP